MCWRLLSVALLALLITAANGSAALGTSPHGAAVLPPALTARGTTITVEGEIGGGFADMRVVDGLIYAVQSRTLLIIDPRDPARLQVRGSLILPRAPSRVVVGGGMAYLLDSYSFCVVDVRDPAQPRLLAAVPVRLMGLPWGGAAWKDGYLYAGTGRAVELYDVRDPARPVLLRALPVSGGDTTIGASAMVGVGSWLVVVTATVPHSLQVWDTSKPAAPALRGALRLPSDPKLLDTVTGLAVSGTTAYLTSDQGLRLVDFSTPGAPKLLGSLSQLFTLTGVEVSGTRAYVSYKPYAPVMEKGLRVIDVADPQNPVPLGDIPLPDLAARVPMIGQTAVVALLSKTFSGVRLLDLHNLQAPVVSGAAALVGGVDRVRVRNGLAFTGGSAYAGLWLIDVRDLARPVLRSSVRLPEPPQALDASPSGVYAYTAYRSSQTANQSVVHVLDATDVFAPAVVGTLVLSATVRDVALLDQTLFVVAANALYVVDVSDPSSPAVLATAPVEGQAYAVTAAGSHVYVVGDYLSIFDISSQERPALVGRAVAWKSSPLRPIAVRAVLDGGRLYTSFCMYTSAGAVSNLDIFDLSDLAAPALIGGWGERTMVLDLQVHNGLAVFANANNSVFVLDLRRPKEPQTLGPYPIPGAAYGVDQSRQQLFYGASGGGLQTGLLLLPQIWLPQVRRGL